MNKLIAIVGMSGSGKSVITEYLQKNNWAKLYFGGITYKLMEEAEIVRTEDGKSEKEFREKLRKDYGKECLAKFLKPDIEKELKTHNVVLDGLYSWQEYKYLIQHFPNLKLICVVIDKKIRYSRVQTREDRPFNQAAIFYRDVTEIEDLDKGGPIAFADYYLLNNGNLDEYYKRLNEIIEDINKEGEYKNEVHES